MHGGGPARLPEIALALLGWKPDAIALSEFRTARGGSLRAVLADHGWAHQAKPHAPPSTNTVFVASRTPIQSVETHPRLPRPLRTRLMTVTLEQGTTITAAHIPDAARSDRDGMRDRTLVWHEIIATAKQLKGTPHAVLGDLNTGRHRIDEPGETFSCTALLGALTSMGYTDAWRAVHGPHARHASWRSHAGAGFRLDHALLSAPLSGSIANAEYPREPLQNRLSDHAPLVVDLTEMPARMPMKPCFRGIFEHHAQKPLEI